MAPTKKRGEVVNEDITCYGRNPTPNSKPGTHFWFKHGSGKTPKRGWFLPVSTTRYVHTELPVAKATPLNRRRNDEEHPSDAEWKANLSWANSRDPQFKAPPTELQSREDIYGGCRSRGPAGPSDARVSRSGSHVCLGTHMGLGLSYCL